jgi:hypothetical protein
MTLLERFTTSRIPWLKPCATSVLIQHGRVTIDVDVTVTSRRADTLDRAYLEPRLREFAESLERPEILTRWTRWSALPAT